ncbi:hypothetical protein JAAARDRAFT_30450 [Jaapia argillacea MUCL 33604]|uniref:Mur ligase central domain-containing protein n=1 Tax=Jaapia argillacea MUCL 33604 TaxID=933084 RepID=A0A067QGB0_9AGAM|nr:hypothetical protein JAAARDRAFT_30450 [Jaapia argillacea MUCL 33604]
MEVGMGGRLDATNVIPDTSILVSAVTAVDLDHQAFLGGSVDAIAREKAGISRKGRPLVLGPQKHQEVLGEVEKVVAESRGELIFAHPAVPRTWDESVDGPLPNAVPLGSASFQGPSPQPVEIPMPCFSAPLRALLPLPGEHQLVNMGLACEVISTILTHPSCNDTRTNLRLSERVTVASIIKGIRSTVWPGRLSFHTISLPDPLLETPRELTVLVDGAHNPSSSATLSSYVSDMLLSIEKRGPQHPTSRPRIISITFILALSHSPPKTPLQTLQPLFPLRFTPSESTRVKLRVALLRFTPPEGMPWVTSESPSILAGVVSSLLGNADADDIWCAPENAVPGLGLAHLKDALQWAAAKQDEDLVSEEGEGFVVLAGSLYLVADLYRLMREDLGRS